jgi:ribosomal protein S18 acetylase RimI-like enzyme
VKKLFIFQNPHDSYKKELDCAYDRVRNDKSQISLAELTIDYLSAGIEVIISNGLPMEWYYILKGMNIVTITLGNCELYRNLADIVIDCYSEDDKRYFTGKNFSICGNANLEVEEIVDLIKIKEWDSKFFGFKVAYLSCMHLTERIMHRINNFIKEENITLLEYPCNCHDNRSVIVAEKSGFHFADIRLTYHRYLKEKKATDLDGLTFEKATEVDIPGLRSISRDFYRDSRYFFDSNFDVAKTRLFFQRWIEKGVRGEFDDECWCLYNKHIPVAFCTIRYDKQNVAHIGLFGVAQQYQGSGLGKKILNSVFNVLIDNSINDIYVVTQGRNYDAQRLYQSAGFKTESTQLWYHKWIR